MEIFIGWDPRDDLAWKACRASIERHASQPVEIRALKDHELRRQGLYDRPYHVDPHGQMVDDRDERPFSTQFAFARFLVPHLARGDWALFCDADFLFRADVAQLFSIADPSYAVMVVQHDHRPDETVKMDGVSQYGYRRKNWSSLMLMNTERCRKALSTDAVSRNTGLYLHGFSWLRDELVGCLPEEWNWLEGYSQALNPKAVHYTRGTPDFPGHEHASYAEEWRGYV